MTLAKLQRVLIALCQRTGNLPSGWIGCSTGGEVELSFHGQLAREQHEYLLRVGFIVPDAEDSRYIYRPRKSSKREKRGARIAGLDDLLTKEERDVLRAELRSHGD